MHMKTNKDKRTTRDDLVKFLKDPASIKKREHAEIERRKAREEKLLKMCPIFHDLSNIGIKIDHMHELNSNGAYTEAVPVLVDHLFRQYDKDIKKDILNALEDKRAKLAVNEIMKYFYNEADFDLKWRAGYVISISAQDDDLPQLYEIANNKNLGAARSEILLAIARLAKSYAIPYLMTFLDDSEQIIYSMAIRALGNLKAIDAEDSIARFLDHHDSWVRQEVKKALKKIERAKAKQSLKL